MFHSKIGKALSASSSVKRYALLCAFCLMLLPFIAFRMVGKDSGWEIVILDDADACIIVSPNPSPGEVCLGVKNGTNAIQNVKISTQGGTVLFNQSYENVSECCIDMSFLSEGDYFIETVTTDCSPRQRAVVTNP